jgi:hypothetical protein
MSISLNILNIMSDKRLLLLYFVVCTVYAYSSRVDDVDPRQV